MLDVFGGMRSPDMKPLMDLFSETRGVESALRILTVLDEEFMEVWRVKNLQVNQVRTKLEFSFTFFVTQVKACNCCPDFPQDKMPLPLSDDGSSTLIEFSGASIGKYLESALGSGTQKLMYVVDVIGAKDKTNRQAFFHANKAKGTTRGNIVRHLK